MAEALPVVLRFSVEEESTPRQDNPERDQSQALDRANANGRRGPAGRLSWLQGRELPGRGPDPGPRPRPPRTTGTWPPWPRREGGGYRRPRASISLRGLRLRVPGRPAGGVATTPVQRSGDRIRARPLGTRERDGDGGATPDQPFNGARLRCDDGLGDLAALGEGGEDPVSVPLGARRGALRDAPHRGGARGNRARGERGSRDTTPAARATRLPRRRARDGMAGARIKRKSSAHLT